jgi:hypothetical protein
MYMLQSAQQGENAALPLELHPPHHTAPDKNPTSSIITTGRARQAPSLPSSWQASTVSHQQLLQKLLT